MTPAARPIGDHLREWRQRRRMSQLALACETDISTKHLSFLETGRASPSRGMILRLAERLDVPLRDRNVLLVAAGFAPVFSEHPLDDAALGAARQAIDLVLRGHEPYPALAVDRHWTLLAANAAASRMLAGAAPHLLAPPVNVLRLSLHPDGVAPRIVNSGEWRAHVLTLRHQIDTTADPVLADLLAELEAYPAPPAAGRAKPDYAAVVPLQLSTESGVLSLISTTTVFGAPRDVTLSEIAIESFFPADAATAEMLRGNG